MLPPTRLRTGFGDVEEEDDDDATDTVFALMRVFMKDAIVVAGQHARARTAKRDGT